MLRMLQPTELARAMGFGEGFKLGSGTRREKIMMIGNSVAPPVMTAIVEALTRPADVVTDGRQRPQPSRHGERRKGTAMFEDSFV
jgi:DNA (cytosine-5)-methyltransferase 1